MKKHKETKDHPLIECIKQRNKARKLKAHPQILKMLDLRVSQAASKVVEQFEKTEKQFPVLEKIRNKTILKKD